MENQRNATSLIHTVSAACNKIRNPRVTWTSDRAKHGAGRCQSWTVRDRRRFFFGLRVWVAPQWVLNHTHKWKSKHYFLQVEKWQFLSFFHCNYNHNIEK
jgi:hypothetical protein